ncbi:FAD-binding oxidoreductase [Aspergillus saccharolyticus JOP 1030-1]|uniref:Delta(24)-sterol reductase n=1 Tax=Aspergillus saccharolyticus JOP 1030-1 TaxID=1450539 RepID=A0A318ZJL9_9EURO|nr:FAD binding domain protein [Aspergillus saccharolyticus JOP 1030-1]PYH47005.1 FAD binding domain protein [Aspergillus saccharolyticus JOP 1030-1]
MEAHKTAVEAVAAQVKQFHARQQPFRIYHGSTNSTRKSQHHVHNTISTADLNHVLHVNEVAKTVTVEPNVPMDALVAATLQHGLVPLVVMEFPGITAGGGFSGTSGESSSFRHGFFDATVLQIEIVIPNGEIRSASRTGPGAELFWGAASAFGTLGVVTLLEIQCRPALPYVELSYISTRSMPEAMEAIRAATADASVEYLDGIVFAKDHIVICAGKLTDAQPASSAPPTLQRFTRPHDPWFYLHAQHRAPRLAQTPSSPPKDYIPLQDYLFRYDRGAFWTGRYAYSYFLTPFTHLTRYLLDSFMHTRVMYHALHQSGLAAQYLIQDVAVPYPATTEFVEWLDRPEHFGHYPIWLCPLLVRSDGGGLMISGKPPSPPAAAAAAATTTNPPSTTSQPNDNDNDNDEKYLLNFGLWAPSPYRGEAFIHQNRRLEHKVQALGGKKWLYAHTYYTEDEFWKIYDWRSYQGLREKYHAGYLPDLFEKVRVRLEGSTEEGWARWARGMVGRVWPVRGLYGVWRAWWGGEYYLKG